MLNPFDFAPYSLRLGTSPPKPLSASLRPYWMLREGRRAERGPSPHKLRGTSQDKLREKSL